MADLERSTTAVPATQPTHSDIESLPALFGRLADDVTTLLDTKLSLAKVEIQEDAGAYIRGAVMIGAGALVAAIGFALLNIALAFFISRLFSYSQPVNYALGFTLTGLLYLIVGGVLIYVMKNRLAARTPVPDKSIEELRKDKQWLKNEI